MIYEVRTYDLKPGSVARWEGHFEATLPNRVKYSELAALWHTDIGPLNQVIHVWPYENLEHRTEVRTKAAHEPGWPPKGGELLLSMESQIWTPAPFSPALGGNRKLGNVYEMRVYEYQPGSMPKVLAAWEKSLPKRLELSPIAGCMYTDIGGLNLWMHIWPYARPWRARPHPGGLDAIGRLAAADARVAGQHAEQDCRAGGVFAHGMRLSAGPTQVEIRRSPCILDKLEYPNKLARIGLMPYNSIESTATRHVL